MIVFTVNRYPKHKAALMSPLLCSSGLSSPPRHLHCNATIADIGVGRLHSQRPPPKGKYGYVRYITTNIHQSQIYTHTVPHLL